MGAGMSSRHYLTVSSGCDVVGIDTHRLDAQKFNADLLRASPLVFESYVYTRANRRSDKAALILVTRQTVYRETIRA